MAPVKPLYSKEDVVKAGRILAGPDGSDQSAWATSVLTNWRALHGYPLNTFQATLRDKLKIVDRNGIVGQRLKRAPSVIAKLQRFPSMRLPQMQDIAGLRAVLANQPKVNRLYESYMNSRFQHELINEKDYIATPKDDGYRGIHLVYRYASNRAGEFSGLHVELQLRTALQHAWATAVETVDAFMGESIKAGRPTEDWGSFFRLASAAFALKERAAPPAAQRGRTYAEVVADLKTSEAGLQVAAKLRGFTVAANKISTSGNLRNTYHLVVLDMGVRRLTVRSYPASQQQQANVAYQAVEERVRSGEPLNPVLITGGSVDGLRKSYPNYFLDARNFIESVERVIGRISTPPGPGAGGAPQSSLFG
jgi:hypothetical protein